MATYGYIKHSELAHHGIKGMKWGVRRYQNLDGSLTADGRHHYGIRERILVKKQLRDQTKQYLSDNKESLKTARNELKEFNKNPDNLFKFKERKGLMQNVKDIRNDRRIVKTSDKYYRKLYMDEQDPNRKKQIGELIDKKNDTKSAIALASIGLGSTAVKTVSKIALAAVVPIVVFAGKEAVKWYIKENGKVIIPKAVDFVKDKIGG